MSFLTKKRSKKFAKYSLTAVALFFTYIIVTTMFVVTQTQWPVTCQDIPIPYTSSTNDDENLDDGVEDVITVGESGQRHVCTRGSGTVVSDDVTLQPVNEVIAHGTRQPEYEDSEDYYQEEPTYGSICNDGWHSPSVGRGACSWHGGVAY